MSDKHSVVAIYDSHSEAEIAVKKLQESGFMMQQVSLVVKAYHLDEHVVGYYHLGERVKYWGKLEAFWDRLWEYLFTSGFFLIPGIGPIVVGGPLVGLMINTLEGATIIGGLSAIGAALHSIGIPKDSIIKYEAFLKANKFLLVAHGTGEEVEQARKILETTNAIETTTYQSL
jgi:hypothetical protein